MTSVHTSARGRALGFGHANTSQMPKSKMRFWKFAVGFGVREGLQSIGNGCGLEIDGFSAHFERYESILNDFHDFGDFEVVSDGLALFLEGPRTFRDRPEGPGTLGEWVMVV